MPVAPFPHHYFAKLSDEQLSAPIAPSIPIGAPPEFGGRDDVWGPEQLLLGATIACLKTTFDAYAARARLHVAAWRGMASGTLDRGAGGPVFTSIHLTVELETDAGEAARAKDLLETAEKHCIISRALAVPVELTTTVREIVAAQIAQTMQ